MLNTTITILFSIVVTSIKRVMYSISSDLISDLSNDLSNDIFDSTADTLA